MKWTSFVLIVCMAAHAGAVSAAKCYSVGDLTGVSGLRAEGFKLDKDGFKGKTFQLLINGQMSIAPEWDIPCREVSPDAVLCAGTRGGGTSLEMWTVDETSKTVLFSRMRSGFGVVDGGAMFVGKIIGTCALSPPVK